MAKNWVHCLTISISILLQHVSFKILQGKLKIKTISKFSEASKPLYFLLAPCSMQKSLRSKIYCNFLFLRNKSFPYIESYLLKFSQNVTYIFFGQYVTRCQVSSGVRTNLVVRKFHGEPNWTSTTYEAWLEPDRLMLHSLAIF